MEIRETPFVLIARVMVKSGKVEEYMKIASTVDEAVEKTEPGMLFHHCLLYTSPSPRDP